MMAICNSASQNLESSVLQVLAAAVLLSLSELNLQLSLEELYQIPFQQYRLLQHQLHHRFAVSILQVYLSKAIFMAIQRKSPLLMLSFVMLIRIWDRGTISDAIFSQMPCSFHDN